MCLHEHLKNGDDNAPFVGLFSRGNESLYVFMYMQKHKDLQCLMSYSTLKVGDLEPKCSHVMLLAINNVQNLHEAQFLEE